MSLPTTPFGQQPLGSSDVYYDRTRGILGSGPTYGESSFNHQPKQSGCIDAFFTDVTGQPQYLAYDPCQPPGTFGIDRS